MPTTPRFGRARARGLLLAFAGLVSLAACATPKRTTVPLATRSFAHQPDARACCLVVLLPGYGDTPQDFVDHGFIAAVKRAGVPVDVLAVAAHTGYYFKGIVATRLHEDVLTPARAAGYEKIWLVGVSMGGFGSLWTAQLHREDVDGVVLLAPYTGRRRIVRPIARVGIHEWQPKAGRGTWDYELWRWLQRAGQPGSAVPPIWLAYGRDDGGDGTRMLTELLPPDHVLVIPGDHDWGTWIPLWDQLLARVPWTAPA